MRKYVLGLFAIVMAVSLSAFTSAKKGSGKTQDLYWFVYTPGTGVGTYLDHGEKSEFEVADCNDDLGTDCRRGYPITALTNQSNPSQGVNNANANLDQIRKQ